MRRRALLASVPTAIVGISGCLGAGRRLDEQVGDEGTTPTPEEKVTTGIPADRLVEIRGNAFHPQVSEVEVGSLVRWANLDERDHEVTSAQFHDGAATWEFTSGVLGHSETVTHRFEEPGVYEFYCSVSGKETACGAVLVGDVVSTGSLPCE